MPGKTTSEQKPHSISMSDETFSLFSKFIQEELGIKMTINKRVMLQARLIKRLRALGIPSYEEYYDYLFSEDAHDNELPFFVHQVTTNKTDFFREPAHFRYMCDHALPTLLKENNYSWRTPLRVWSSACSTGEEPYTLAMVLADYAHHTLPLNYSIMATDISPTVLQTAVQGVYESSKVDPVPYNLKRRYLLRSREKNKKLVRIVPELRNKVRFSWINLKAQSLNIDKMMDIIFCRNVIIYFNRPTQEKVIGNLCKQLKIGGYLFMGHSETLSGFTLPLEQVATTIYRKI